MDALKTLQYLISTIGISKKKTSIVTGMSLKTIDAILAGEEYTLTKTIKKVD